MAEKTGSGRKAGGGLARPVQPSAELGAVVGNDPLPRSQVAVSYTHLTLPTKA